MHCTPIEKLKARKPHRCMSCGEPIAVDETYYRWRSYSDGDATTNKMHPECYEMHDADGGMWEYSLYNYERPQAVPNAKVTGERLYRPSGGMTGYATFSTWRRR